MSHVATIKTALNDLTAVKAACERMGWQFMEGQQKYAWWGHSVGDYNAADEATRNGIKAEDLGKCAHAIRVPGAKYEIGLVAMPNGSFQPAWDWYSSGGLQSIRSENGMAGFLQAYGVEKAKIEARKKGMSVSETKLPDGRIQVRMVAR